jgi:hypothetical protein
MYKRLIKKLKALCQYFVIRSADEAFILVGCIGFLVLWLMVVWL